MAKEDDWEQLWAHTESAFGGKVTLLVNNAGVNPKHGWTACINIMLTGVGYGTFLAIEKMGKSKVKVSEQNSRLMFGSSHIRSALIGVE